MPKILLVGSGLTNAVIYTRLIDTHVSPDDITIVEARNTIGGNCYTEAIPVSSVNPEKRISGTLSPFLGNIFSSIAFFNVFNLSNLR